MPALARKLPATTSRCTPPRAAPVRRLRGPEHQRGLVLIVALIMLGVISLLAISSVRNAASTETVAGNVRTTELATQAAEIALRHCEASVLETLSAASGAPAAYPTTFNSGNILSPASAARWQNMANWDSTTSAAYVLPLTMVNQPGMATTTYKRPPECMVEPLPVMPAGAGAVLSTSTSFVITARGFGPEVLAASTSRSRPVGSEVWMQSQIDVQ